MVKKIRVFASPACSSRKINPYNYLLYQDMDTLGVEIIEGRLSTVVLRSADILHLHWPEGYLCESQLSKALHGSLMTLSVILLAKIKGSKIFWTVHNHLPHENPHPVLTKWFYFVFFKLLDALFVLSEESKEKAFATHPKLRALPCFLTPHGHYRGVFPESISRHQARAKFSFSRGDRVGLFLGNIRPYKNVTHLVKVFRQMDHSCIRLVIAGLCKDEGLANDLRVAANGDSRIRLDLGFVPDEKIQIYLRAADVVILPFTDILNSGSIMLPLSFDRPVIVPALGSILELRKSLGPKWVRTYDSVLDSETFASLFWEPAPKGAHCPLENYDWRKIADATANAYATVLGRLPV